MFPLLTILGDAIGIFGGLLIAVLQLEIMAGFHINDVLRALTLDDIFSGIGKPVLFDFWLAIVDCYNGLQARGGVDESSMLRRLVRNRQQKGIKKRYDAEQMELQVQLPVAEDSSEAAGPE